MKDFLAEPEKYFIRVYCLDDSSPDGRTFGFRTLKEVKEKAQHYVGAHPEIVEGYNYAVSEDGICKVRGLNGLDLKALFPTKEF